MSSTSSAARLGVHERGVELGDVRVGELEHVGVAERRRAATRSSVSSGVERRTASIAVIGFAPASVRVAGPRTSRPGSGPVRFAVLVGDLARHDRGDVAVGRLHEALAAGGQVVAHLGPARGEALEVDDVDVGAVAGREHAAVEQADGRARCRCVCRCTSERQGRAGRGRGRGPRA